MNEQILYASSDEIGNSKSYPFFKEFMRENLRKSPISMADHIESPLLILHGAEDCRTPVEAAKQLYTAVRDTHPDLPVKLVLFPGTCHEQPRDPILRKQYYEEMLEWFRTYL